MRYFHAKRFSLALSMRITPCGIEAVAAMHSWIAEIGRIVKCQISYLRRNRDARHLRNDVCTIIYIYIDSASVVRTRWGLLRLVPIISSPTVLVKSFSNPLGHGRPPPIIGVWPL